MIVTKLVLSLSIVATLLFASCARTSKAARLSGNYDCSARINDAIDALERRRHGEVIKILGEVKYQCGGDPVMDTVHYYMATAYMRQKQFVDARAEFEYLSREHPYSPFAPEALFRIGQIVYNQSNPYDRDQTQTTEAIRLIHNFLDTYPGSSFVDSAQVYLDKAVEKLAAKEYNNARFYRKQGKNDAALVYYRSLISKFPHSGYRVKGIVDMAEILTDAGRIDEAREVLTEIGESELDETLKSKLELLQSRINTEK